MDDTNIPIIKRKVTNGRIFYDKRIDNALAECYKAGCNPLFMPDLILSRLDSDLESKIWDKNFAYFDTASVRGIGKTKSGLKVVVYAHIPTMLSNPKILSSYILNREVTTCPDDIRCYSVNVPKEEFHRILDLEDNQTVFVLDYSKFSKMSHGNMRLSKMLKHPVTVPYLGVGKERAEEYLEKHVKVYCKVGIGFADGEWKQYINHEYYRMRDLEKVEYSLGILTIAQRLECSFLFNLSGNSVAQGRFLGVPDEGLVLLNGSAETSK